MNQGVLNITSVCICVLAVVIRHANLIFSAPHYNITCDLFGCTIFFHVIS